LAHGSRLDNQNIGEISGSCPDAETLLKIEKTRTKIITKIALSCPDPYLTTRLPTNCAFEAPTAAG
jgi:hypothetical protein